MNFLLLPPFIALVLSLAWFGFLGRPRFLSSTLLNQRRHKNKENGTEQGEQSSVGLSVIIPARNELGRIEPLLKSLQQQEGVAYEVIVVDDHSEDGTGLAAKKLGAKVLPAQDLPEGWKGKPWACFQGANMAQYPWLLFLDADLQLAEGALQRLASLATGAKQKHEPNATDWVFSLCPYHRLGSSVEGFSAFFNILMVAGTGCFGLHRPEFERLFGQSMLIEKQLYERIGGHELVKNEVLENFELSKHLTKAGVQTRSFLGKGVLSMRMYGAHLGEISAGWRKSFVQGARGSSKSVLVLSSLWITAMMFGIGSLSLLFWGELGAWKYFVGGVYLWLAALCFVSLRWVGTYALWLALLWPIPLLFYQWVFFGALLSQKQGKSTSWKGREV